MFALTVAQVTLQLAWCTQAAIAHDIPNQRVDRSTQATLLPGKLEIDYEVSLTELTLTQDLRRLVGSLPGADRTEWLSRYGEVTGPLNAKGFLVHCEGRPIALEAHGFDLAVEEHPRYTFHFSATLPDAGRLVIQDTNYVSSEGTSRLAVRGQEGIIIEGDDLPIEVADIPIRPVWQLSDEEERRTRLVEVHFRAPAARSHVGDILPAGLSPTPTTLQARSTDSARADSTSSTPSTAARLGRLLDRDAGASWLGVMLIAAALGAAHSIQPGHGKTLISAVALGSGIRWFLPVLLGLVTTLTHTGSVLLIAAGLWWTGSSQVAGLHQALAHLAGFVIAAGGLWRIGRTLNGSDSGEGVGRSDRESTTLSGVLALGLAGGLVPCWDAVSLVILSAAVDRLPSGIILVVAFGLGMGAVLITFGVIASRVQSFVASARGFRGWERTLSLLSGGLLAVVGLAFFLG